MPVPVHFLQQLDKRLVARAHLIVGRFAGDGDVVDVAFPEPGARDAAEPGVLLHFRDAAVAGVAHGRAQAPHQLVHDGAERPLVGHAAFDSFGDQLQIIADVLLEIAVRRAPGHGAQRAHAAIGLVGAPLVQEHLARTFVGAGEERSDHHAIGAGGDGLGDVAGKLDAAVGDDRNVLFPAGVHRVGDGGKLGHADTRDHPGGADGTRPDADLDAVRPGIDQCLGAFAGGDVAGHHLDVIAEFLDALHRLRHALGMAVGGVDHDHVDFGIDQGFGAADGVVADADGRRGPQPSLRVLAGVGVLLRLFDVLHGDQADATEIVVHHQKLLDPVLVKQSFRLFPVDAVPHRDQRPVVGVRGHQLADALVRVVGETHVAVGENAHQPAAGTFHHRDAGNVVQFLDHQGIGQGGVGGDSIGVHHHARFEFLDAANLRRL